MLIGYLGHPTTHRAVHDRDSGSEEHVTQYARAALKIDDSYIKRANPRASATDASTQKYATPTQWQRLNPNIRHANSQAVCGLLRLVLRPTLLHNRSVPQSVASADGTDCWSVQNAAMKDPSPPMHQPDGTRCQRAGA